VKVYQRKHKGGARWCCDLHVTPAGETASQRFRLTAPASVTSKSGADRWAREQLARIASQGPPPSTKRAREKALDLAAQAERERVPTLGEWWRQYQEHLALERKASGQAARASIYANWLRSLADTPLPLCCSEITIRRLRATVAESPRKVSAKRVNGVIVTLLACLRYAARTLPHLGLVVPRIKPLRVETHVADCYSVADTQAILAACDPVEAAQVLLMLDAGLRAGEVCALRWGDVDLRDAVVTVRATIHGAETTSPKSGKSRTVPLTDRTVAALEALRRRAEWVFPATLRGGPSTHCTLSRHLRRACERAGVEYLGCHPLRHAYATQSLRVRVDLRTLQDRLGHSAISITSGYLHPSAPRERQGVAALEAALSAPAETGTDLTRARSRKARK